MKELIVVLKQGAEVWNQWRQSNSEIKIDFSKANLSRLDLSNVNLKGAKLNQVNFREAKLSGANLIGAFLNNADLRGASLYMTKLNRANLDEANLKGANIQKADLTGATLREAILEKANLVNTKLIRANCSKSNITGASLISANLMNADFSKAILRRSNLTRIQGLSTNFNKANLTGACIEDWHINRNTNFENLNCEYIYLRATQHERRPSSGIFQPGQCTKLFEEAFSTVDFIFNNGIDWKAFIETIKTVQGQNEDTPLEVSSIENKGDGVFVVKVKVPPDANKEKIHQEFEENYKLKLQAVEANYKRLLAEKDIEKKDEIIKIHHEHNANMMEIIKNQASRSIIVEAKAMSNSSDSSQNVNIRDINNSGIFNLQKSIEDVNKIINKIPENSNKSNTELNALLKELITAINSEDSLDKDEKVEAVNQVKKIAESCQKPENESLKNKAKRAVNFLEIIAKGVEPTSKLVKAFQNVLPFIISRLG